jgi:hypothetical protein
MYILGQPFYVNFHKRYQETPVLLFQGGSHVRCQRIANPVQLGPLEKQIAITVHHILLTIIARGVTWPRRRSTISE